MMPMSANLNQDGPPGGLESGLDALGLPLGAVLGSCLPILPAMVSMGMLFVNEFDHLRIH